MTVKARMKVTFAHMVGEGAKQVYMQPVYSDDKTSPNYSYSQATPAGQLQLLITNPNAWPLFEQDASIDMTFERTPE